MKPQNLLLSTNEAGEKLLKIADFGFARSLQPQGLAETLCGSPLYMAPEILQFHKYDAKADLWSVGTILYELVVGAAPACTTSDARPQSLPSAPTSASVRITSLQLPLLIPVQCFVVAPIATFLDVIWLCLSINATQSFHTKSKQCALGSCNLHLTTVVLLCR